MQKSLDNKGRWRDITVAFRMSQAENNDLNTKVRLSGLTKQDYIIARLQCRDVAVTGNPRVYKALKNQMSAILTELKQIEAGAAVDTELLDTINLIAVTLNGLKGE